MIPISIPKASKVFNVSSNVSPLARDEFLVSKFKTSAPSLFDATSKENRVLVECSKNKFAIIVFFNVFGGCFLDFKVLEKKEALSKIERIVLGSN